MLILCFKYLYSRKLTTDIVISRCFKKISCTDKFLRRCIPSTNIFKIRMMKVSFPKKTKMYEVNGSEEVPLSCLILPENLCAKRDSDGNTGGIAS